MAMLMKQCKGYRCRNSTRNADGYCDECRERYRSTHAHEAYEREKDQKRPTSRQRGYDSRWDAFRRNYLQLHPTCAICGEPARVVDHKDIPADVMMDTWGSFDYSPEHYQALCYRCNTIKGRGYDRKARQEHRQALSDAAVLIDRTRGES